MFSTLKLKITLGVYIFIILSIPVGAYLAQESQIFKSKASEGSKVPIVKKVPKPSTPATKELLSSVETAVLDNPDSSPSPSPEESSPTIATSFGPTLSLKASLEGRPQQDQSTKLFIGIFEGELTENPTFILSFSIDLPKDGTYSNLSLAGLTSGTTYTALLKGASQLAVSSTFVMSPTVTNLNDGQALSMLTGDLNEDNVVSSADLTLAQNGNANADFNLDGAINAFDLAIITKNMDAIGASGVWTSPIPTAGTPSAQGGYWLWLPR